MKTIFSNISVILMALLVMLLSMGINVSIMQCCDQSGKIFIGTEVPSCNTEEDLISASNQENTPCCVLEVKKLCCPEEDNCLIEIDLIKFDFETLVISYNQLVPSFSSFILTSLFTGSVNLELHHSNITYRPPPDKLYQPVFSQIQSFLL